MAKFARFLLSSPAMNGMNLAAGALFGGVGFVALRMGRLAPVLIGIALDWPTPTSWRA